MFCKDCDEPIHAANTRAANHQRFLATGIRVALGNSCNNNSAKTHTEPKPPKSYSQQSGSKTSPPHHVSGFTSPSWGVDDLLQFSDYESSNKVNKERKNVMLKKIFRKCSFSRLVSYPYNGLVLSTFTN